MGRDEGGFVGCKGYGRGQQTAALIAVLVQLRGEVHARAANASRSRGGHGTWEATIRQGMV